LQNSVGNKIETEPPKSEWLVSARAGGKNQISLCADAKWLVGYAMDPEAAALRSSLGYSLPFSLRDRMAGVLTEKSDMCGYMCPGKRTMRLTLCFVSSVSSYLFFFPFFLCLAVHRSMTIILIYTYISEET
jgi:hypothetical protein